MPNVEYLSAVAAYLEDGVFLTSPGNSRDFIRETLERSREYSGLMKKLGGREIEPRLIALDKEGAAEGLEGVDVQKTPEAFVKKILEALEVV